MNFFHGLARVPVHSSFFHTFAWGNPHQRIIVKLEDLVDAREEILQSSLGPFEEGGAPLATQ